MKSLIDEVLIAPYIIDDKDVRVGDIIYWYSDDHYVVLHIGPERFLLQDIKDKTFRHGSINYAPTYKVKTMPVTQNLINEAKAYARIKWNAMVVEKLGL